MKLYNKIEVALMDQKLPKVWRSVALDLRPFFNVKDLLMEEIIFEVRKL